MSGPIVVFDSGVGGLSILDEIRKVLPDQDYCYLFDNARLPYGELEEQELVDGCKSLIVAIVEQVSASLVVIACNTASTLVLPVLRETLTIPVVGVVPAIKPAALYSQAKHIGLLATPGTIQRSYTHSLIKQFASSCRVELFGSSELVLLAEKKAAGKAILQEEISQLLYPIKASALDTLVLGCTHFPILKAEIQEYLGYEVLLLDSGKAVAARVSSLVGRGVSKISINSKEMNALYTQDIEEGLKKSLVEFGFSSISKVQTD
ncbi:glutamate racemase [Shewanella sp. D64]|uniref:glutamate racemase n=1 Tax=unclassified Shewanella TaxID=196818 RepID=UPI0022BA3C9E|nr:MULTISPECIES: glutamate racemase [unclassified Shewanella]MEC4729060.1 glutamate racemase [Shewanella sp. D64]MEC4740851.1 glutamate racemase [Shewanella sp. E94]WBJ95284.1 glutamate racemase [Shewanella sp. MTB7]